MITVGSYVVTACQGSASKDCCSGVIAGLSICWLRSRKENGRNGIAGAGKNEQLVITEEAGVVPVFPGEEEHMQSPGCDGGCV